MGVGGGGGDPELACGEPFGPELTAEGLVEPVEGEGATVCCGAKNQNANPPRKTVIVTARIIFEEDCMNI